MRDAHHPRLAHPFFVPPRTNLPRRQDQRIPARQYIVFVVPAYRVSLSDSRKHRRIHVNDGHRQQRRDVYTRG